MGFLDSILTGVGFVVKGVGEGLQELGSTVRRWGEQIISSFTSPGQSITPQTSQDHVKQVQETLQTIDIEFVELEKKQSWDGWLSKKDQEYLSELRQLRQAKFDELQEAKKIESAIQQKTSADEYNADSLDDEKVHILQYQMGQLALDKQCPICGKSMFLQHQNKLDGRLYRISDFFWSCMDFYSNNPQLQCKGKRDFSGRDIGMLYKSEIELTISNTDLNTIFHEPTSITHISKRMREHIKGKDNEILCKQHHIPMILDMKNNPVGGLLDAYYLKCPHPSCGQKVKLKSPAQLAAFLKRREGRGLL
ncbi:MAG: hypothetical protein GC158_15185 [Cyanobacteria bacterium RI_101]|nr:hypothetical protein [Cyanobacteria bacterium RI_101]